ncbi:MAG TPA: hypothetical protein VLF90_02335 [Patescibacteria group bacterium]|nr:hypothetical protein [Patescibacteria group bacterium]
MKNLKKISILLLLWGGLIVFLVATNPNKLSIGWLLLPFVWLFIALFFTILLLTRLVRPSSIAGSRRKRYSAIAIVAALPCVMLLLDSVDQLTPKDGLLLVGIGIGAVFYVSRLKT